MPDGATSLPSWKHCCCVEVAESLIEAFAEFGIMLAQCRGRHFLVVAVLFPFGCRIHPGTNHLLLVTKANSGLDMDTLPATVELSAFGRFDGVHGPTFENAQALPVVTAFQRGEGSVESWPYAGALFAAGPAAMAVALGDGKSPDVSKPLEYAKEQEKNA